MSGLSLPEFTEAPDQHKPIGAMVVTTNDGPRAVLVFDTRDGLAITEHIHRIGYNVTHTESGWTINAQVGAFGSIKEALAYRERALQLGDWFRSSDAIKSDKKLCAEMGRLIEAELEWKAGRL